jgi:exopolyphosphatase/guanosine-5'-triphosphate,3'-diphosphate pyrophosphatase
MKKEIPTKAGVVDIGSSSIKLIIGETSGKDIKILESLKNSLPIGKHTFFRERISQDTINQIVSILEKYKKILSEYDITSVTAIATTAVREANNKDMFLDTIFRKTGFTVEVLNAGDVVYYIDAYISHKLKNAYPIHSKDLLIGELGAGSLDVSLMQKGVTLLNLGLAIGTLRLKQLMNELNGSFEEICEAVQEYIGNDLNYLKSTMPKTQVDDIILIDEKYSPYLAAILPEKKQEGKFFQVTPQDAKKIFEQLSGKSPEEISKEFNIPSEISDTIIAYSMMLKTLLSIFKSQYIYILETSLAEAILANILLNVELSEKYDKIHQLISVAKFYCERYNLNINHAQNVANLSQILFDKLKDYLGLTEDDLIYLMLAAYLHDIGVVIHNRSHHKHSEYMINCLSLFRLTEEEIKVIACVARYHRKAPPMKAHLLYNSLPLAKRIQVQKLAALLRISNSLDRSHKQKVKNLEVKLGKSQEIILTVHTQENMLLEKADFMEKKEMFEEITGSKVNLIIKN